MPNVIDVLLFPVALAQLARPRFACSLALLAVLPALTVGTKDSLNLVALAS
jgi:hypothetical protein